MTPVVEALTCSAALPPHQYFFSGTGVILTRYKPEAAAVPCSGTDWLGRGLLREGRCGGEHFPSFVFSWHS